MGLRILCGYNVIRIPQIVETIEYSKSEKKKSIFTQLITEENGLSETPEAATTSWSLLSLVLTPALVFVKTKSLEFTSMHCEKTLLKISCCR